MPGLKAKQGSGVNMLDGPLGQNILRFTLPLALTGVLQQLFNAADVAVVGRFVGADAMAAVGSNSSIVGLIVNLFVGLSLGSNVVISQLTGMGKTESIRRAVDVSLLLALVCGGVAALGCQLLVTPLLTWMKVPGEIFPMAAAYLRIYLLGLPVILLYNFEAAIFRSQGDSITPLIGLAVSGIINVILNLVFVIACGMTADGVALATVLSNLISACILFLVLTRTDRPIGVRRHKVELDRGLLKKIVAIGLPAGIQSALFSVSNICIQSAINELGGTVMAASAAAFNVEIFLYYVVNAFGQACTTFTGQNNGAGNHPRCRAVFRWCFGLSMGVTAVLSGVMLLAGEPLLSLFNSEEAVVRYGMVRLKYILSFEVVSVVMEIVSGALRGYGISTSPAVLTLVGTCGLRIAWVYMVFPKTRSFGSLLLCYPISWALTSLLLTAVYLFYMRAWSAGKRKPAD